jgi:hypothetical protein
MKLRSGGTTIETNASEGAGSVRAVTPTPKKPHSALHVSPNGRYFVDRSGAPAFWLGDTLWELFRLYDSDTALHLLRQRQAQGFNVILVMLTGVDTARFGLDTAPPHCNLAGEIPWIDNDPLRPNERYFRHIDALIRLGELTGQTLIVGIYHQWHVDIVTLEKARPWARWVAQRYRDVPNLIWSMYPRATPDYIPVCRELAAGLQEGDGGAHLISVHPDPAIASSSFLHTEPWLAFNMIQTCIEYEQIPAAVTADYQRVPVKPVVMAEGGYEGVEFGKRQTTLEIRRQAYWTHLAGGHHVYGHNDAWTAPQRWAEWIDALGAASLQVFRDILTGLPEWWQIVPDATLLTAGAGSGGLAQHLAARHVAGEWVLVYLSEPGTVSVRLDVLAENRAHRAVWIDPRNGARVPAGAITAQPEMAVTSPTDWEDALLWIGSA